MSWITVVWSMNAGACFVLAGVCFVVWCKQRESWPHLLFSCSAVAAGIIALIELTMLRANTVGQYTALVRWIHAPVWVLTLSLLVLFDFIFVPEHDGWRGAFAGFGRWGLLWILV